MSKILPPGVLFLARVLPRLFSLPLLVGLGVHYASRRAGTKVPVWATLLLASASLPVYLVYRNLRKNARHRAEAASLGARFVPLVPSFGVGNVGFLPQMAWNRKFGYPGDGMAECLDATGSPVVNFRVLWQDIMFTTWPQHIQLILAADSGNYVKGERFQYGMDSVLGSGVFNSDGEMWKFHRGMTRPYFARDKISHFDIFDQHADDVIAIMKQRFAGGYSVNFQDLIGRFTMDSATEFLFGVCVDSLKANIPYAHNVAFPPPQSHDARAETANKFVEAFNEAMVNVAEREHLGFVWPLFEMFRDKTAAPMKIVNAYLDPIIGAAVEKKRTAELLKKEAAAEVEAETLLDDLLQSTSDPKVLKDETLNILLAGRDTTMHVMTIVIYFLSIYPDVCTKLREEILEHVGPTRRPTHEDIKDIKFLRAVINESMRLYPSVPFNTRECIHSTTWPSPDPNEKPLYIPAGSKTPYGVFFMHRNKELWGPDAEEFSPERFLDERLKKYLLPNPFQFLPFNAGPRICLGQQFAYNEMSFMLVRLLQAFSSFTLDEEGFAPEARPPKDWKNLPGRKGKDRFRPALHLTMYTQDGMWIRAKEADPMI
ncbi:cytochrome P450 [Roridomyces roridus]|uniref:Cytochrome P450 n=1 Tax=Roridomyces roridus TaxID=1738132 RepID=A0AAD7FI87_9AGAR|nr:cytochrome P450 [Roridomyces roridus]